MQILGPLRPTRSRDLISSRAHPLLQMEERKGFIRAHQLFPHFCKNKSVHSQKLIFSAAVEAAKKIIIYLGCDSGCQRSHILNRKCLQTLAWKIEKQIILSFHLCWKFFYARLYKRTSVLKTRNFGKKLLGRESNQ